ncbi:hypothetical protein DIPPA_06440 [Diplonema papillatum]|nr:hypothetical protein DIPPA_06440 [Diplonema papillatum]
MQINREPVAIQLRLPQLADLVESNVFASETGSSAAVMACGARPTKWFLSRVGRLASSTRTPPAGGWNSNVLREMVGHAALRETTQHVEMLENEFPSSKQTNRMPCPRTPPTRT